MAGLKGVHTIMANGVHTITAGLKGHAIMAGLKGAHTIIPLSISNCLRLL